MGNVCTAFSCAEINDKHTDNNVSTVSQSCYLLVPQKSQIRRILIIQNDELGPPGTAITSLNQHSTPYQILFAFHKNAFKNLNPSMYEAIIVLGGRIGVHDSKQVKWLQNEINFIKHALIEKVPIFGICLGAQILAKCCGGKVVRGDKGAESGYFDWIFLNNNNDDPFMNILQTKHMDKYIFLNHEDTFINLPSKSILNNEAIEIIAKTPKYSTLFKIGKYCYGFQGHPEINYNILNSWYKLGALQKNTLLYCKTNEKIIDKTGKLVFDIWIDIVLSRNTLFTQQYGNDEENELLMNIVTDLMEQSLGNNKLL